ncbi:glycosyltransferase family 39 protein [Vicingaceae bacterium]|nr:glycosyltransferase family 39 protein [Vicingaceae bacterium]MDC1451077.1 glycosyltransferase family 39 protein [Vicingaceae bacterium]
MFWKFEIRDYTAAIFILIGVALRFYGFSDWSLSNDELSALSRTNFSSFSELIDKGIWVDGHPALIQIFEFYWVQLFGNSVFYVRLPFVLMSIGASIYFYRLLDVWLNKNAVLIGLALFVPNYLFVLYSQIARPYTAGLFFVIAFSFYLFRCLKSSEVKRNYKGIILFGLAASLTHYFAALAVFLIYLSASIYWNKKNLKCYFLLAFTIVLLYLPHLPITINHLSIAGVSWLPKPEPDYLKHFISYFFQRSFILQSTLFAVLLFIGIRKGLKIDWKPTLIASFVFFSCFAIAYYYSIHQTPVLQFSVLIFVAPFLILLIVAQISNKASKKLIMVLSSILILAGSYALIVENQVYSKKPFANFEDTAKNSVRITKKLGKENVLSIANASNPFYLEYYTSQIDPAFEYNIENIDESITIAEIRDIIENSAKEYVLIAYANSVVPSEIHEFAKQKYPVVYFHERYFNSDVIVYAKGSQKRETTFEASYLNNLKWDVNRALLQDSVFYSDRIAFHQTNETLYGLTYKDTLNNLVNEKNRYLTISGQLHSTSPVDMSLVLDVNRGDSSVYWRGTNVKPYYSKDKWYQFIYVFEKPDNLLPSDEVVIYFWNPKKENVYIDEVKMYNFADSDYNYYKF